MSPVIPPSLIEAARSGEVRGANLAVYIELHEWLDTEEYRKPQAWNVAQHVKLDECNVYRAIRYLHRLGFLERGPRNGNAFTFRISNGRQVAA